MNNDAPEAPPEAVCYSLERQTIEGWQRCERAGRDWWTLSEVSPAQVASSFGDGTYRATWTRADRRRTLCRSVAFRATASPEAAAQSQQAPQRPAPQANPQLAALIAALAPEIGRAVRAEVAKLGPQQAPVHPSGSPLATYQVLRQDVARDAAAARDMERQAWQATTEHTKAMFGSLLEMQSQQHASALEREREGARSIAKQQEAMSQERLAMAEARADKAAAEAAALAAIEPQVIEVDEAAAEMRKLAMYGQVASGVADSTLGKLLTSFLEAKMVDHLGIGEEVTKVAQEALLH